VNLFPLIGRGGGSHGGTRLHLDAGFEEKTFQATGNDCNEKAGSGGTLVLKTVRNSGGQAHAGPGGREPANLADPKYYLSFQYKGTRASHYE
jgi:hypothetical protein